MKTGAASAGCTNQNSSVYFRAANDPTVFTITEKGLLLVVSATQQKQR